MATCRGIHHIFDTNPAIPENLSSFIDSISTPWRNKIKPPNPTDQHSFTEIFGELHFKENNNGNNNNHPSSHSSSSQSQKEEEEKWRNMSKFSPYHKRSESSSSMNSESLQLCTEGLGFESLDNLEDLDMDFQSSVMRERVVYHRIADPNKEQNNTKGKLVGRNEKRGLTSFPPPISSIGGGNHVLGKPSVCFESYREDGRFILKEVRIQTHECLRACREDGRLRLSLVQETEEEDEFESQEEEEQEQEEGEEEEVREEEETKGDHGKGNQP